MTSEQKQIPKHEDLEKAIWNQEAKNALSKVYDIWDKIENTTRLELRPAVKELEHIVSGNIVKNFGNDRFLLSLTHNYISIKMQNDGKDERLRLFVKNCMEPEHLRIELSNLKYGAPPDLPEECSLNTREILIGTAVLKGKFPEHFGIRNFQEIAQEYHDGIGRIEQMAEEYGIPLPYHNKELPGDKKPHIRLKAADISKQELIRLLQNTSIEQWIGHTDDIENIIESLRDYNYVSEFVETEEKNVFRTEALRCLLKPLVDRKWQRDWGEWCDILENFYNQGGTYASSKSAVDSTLINTKTGKPIQRKITKEQIDAKHVDYLNDMRFMVTHLRHGAEAAGSTGNPDKIAYFETEDKNKIAEVERYNFKKEQLDSMHIMIIKEMRQLLKETTWVDLLQKRFREKERAYRATRSIELNPVLSEAA